jgi:hypothetical protein
MSESSYSTREDLDYILNIYYFYLKHKHLANAIFL